MMRLLEPLVQQPIWALAGEKSSQYVKNNDLGTGTFRTMLIDLFIQNFSRKP